MLKRAFLLVAWLGGCVSNQALDEALDRDHDGFLPVDAGGDDCDDADPGVHPGASEICGDAVDNDCDGATDDNGEGAAQFWFDGDGDGLGDATHSVTACPTPPHFVANSDDCDDSDANIKGPELLYADGDGDGVGAGGQVEACAGPGWAAVGGDCDDSEPSIGGPAAVWNDGDGDGFGGGPSFQGCPDDGVAVGGDCDDGDGAIHPGVDEICGDGADNDCDGAIDDDGVGDLTWWTDSDSDGLGDPNSTGTACELPSDATDNALDCDDTNALVGASPAWYRDSDGDLSGDPADFVVGCTPPQGYVADGGDCDDTTTAISPFADEICNGIDDDCDLDIDESDAVDAPLWYYDLDDDGHGAGVGFPACEQPDLTQANDDDCDDADPARSPDAEEICFDGIDNDCDASNDDVTGSGGTPWWTDADDDGFGDALQPGDRCVPPDHSATNPNDCADANTAIGAEYLDTDLDGYGDAAAIDFECSHLGDPAYVQDDTDCEDTIAAINPGQPELCATAGIDDDCDGVLEGDDPAPADGEVWYADPDGDLYGSGPPIVSCAPASDTQVDGDCDENDDEVNPGAPEACFDGIDNNCDLKVDDDGVGATLYWADTDLDGWGDAAQGFSACTPPTYKVTFNPDDCNDSNPAVGPEYADGDGDGFGDPALRDPSCAGLGDPAFVQDGTDCDDATDTVNPGELELCDALQVDEDCDGAVNDPTASDAADYYVDADLDGFGTGPAVHQCDPGDGWSVVPGDCRDDLVDVNPAAVEVCGDSLDNDCDQVPEDDDQGIGDIAYWDDRDDDGWGNPAAPHRACVPPIDGALNGDDCDDNDRATGPEYADADADGFGDPALRDPSCANLGDPAFVQDDTDCDDATDTVNPGELEVCDALQVDEDCDGAVNDPSASDAADYYVDADLDGFGTGPAVHECDPGGGWSLVPGDCRDDLFDVNPAAVEVCGDSLDNDCDQVPEGDDQGIGDIAYWDDGDGDGWGNPAAPHRACVPPIDGALNGDDCDDNNTVVGPQYADTDADQFGDPLVIDPSCASPTGFELNNLDCDDRNPAINPDAVEVCNGFDDDCDGGVDGPLAVGAEDWFVDADGDGFGAGAPDHRCDPGDGYSDVPGDCDDARAFVNPEAPERCTDAFDDDCDGNTDSDQGLGDFVWYRDLDGDGFGDVGNAGESCVVPANAVLDSSDCNDANLAVGPPIQLYVDADLDAIGSSVQVLVCPAPGYSPVTGDCNDNVAAIGLPEQLYHDTDGDGWGNDPVQTHCPGVDWVAQGGDCETGNPAVHPGALEIACNGHDDDCDASTPEGPVMADAASFATIQQAIDGSTDDLTLCSGNYVESVVIDRPVAITSLHGAAVTSISANTSSTFTITAGGSVSLTRLELHGKSGVPRGGVINATDPGTHVTLDTVVLEAGSATGKGGLVASDGPLTLVDASLTGGSVATDGACLWVDNDVDLLGTTALAACDATGDGGGVWSSGTVTASASASIDRSSANRGGAMFLSGGLGDVNGVEIDSNTATTGGGAIWLDLFADFTGGRLSNNTSAGDGGAVWLGGGTLTGVEISGTTQGNRGGGVFGSGAILGGTITGASATTSGGGVYADGPLTVDAAVISAGTAFGGDGGGIYAEDSLTLVNAGVDSCEATAGSGGGLYSASDLTLSGTTLISANSASDGGGVWLGGELTVIGTPVIRDNTAAPGDGGGLYHAWPAGAHDVVTATGLGFDGNSATGVGGALYLTYTDWTGGSFTGNSAASGGGVYAEWSTLTGATVSGNTATADGGGVLGTVAILVNDAVSWNAAQGNGGGVANLPPGPLLVEGGSYTNNSAVGDGGAVSVVDAVGGIGAWGATFQQNHADGNGGAIAADNADLILGQDAFHNPQAPVTLSANSAGGEGGALYHRQGASASDVDILGGSWTSNTAVSYGGGLSDDGQVVLDGVVISANKTTAARGGAVSVVGLGSGLVVDSSTLSDNLAQIDEGGAIYLSAGSLDIWNTVLSGNNATLGAAVSWRRGQYVGPAGGITDSDVTGNSPVGSAAAFALISLTAGAELTLDDTNTTWSANGVTGDLDVEVRDDVKAPVQFKYVGSDFICVTGSVAGCS